MQVWSFLSLSWSAAEDRCVGKAPEEAMRMVRGLQHLHYENRLRELELLSQRRGGSKETLEHIPEHKGAARELRFFYNSMER